MRDTFVGLPAQFPYFPRQAAKAEAAKATTLRQPSTVAPETTRKRETSRRCQPPDDRATLARITEPLLAVAEKVYLSTVPTIPFRHWLVYFDSYHQFLRVR